MATAKANAMFTITDTGDLNGRNLIQRSFFTKDPWTGPTYNAVGDGFGMYHDKYCLCVSANYLYSNTGGTQFHTLFPDLTFLEGQQYTLSGKALENRADSKYTGQQIKFIYTDGTYDNVRPIPLNSEKNKWVDFAFTTDAGKTLQKISDMYGNNGSTYFADLKLEVGAAATDWTPAPEDMNTVMIDTKAAQSTANDAQTAADNAQTDATYAKNEIDGLEIGGRNILLNSGGDQPGLVNKYGNTTLNKETNIKVSEWGTTDAVRYYGTGGSTILLAIIGGSTSRLAQSTPCYIDSPYTFSAYVKNLSEDKSLVLHINGLPVSSDVTIAPNEAVRYIKTYTNPSLTIGVQLQARVAALGDAFDFILWHPKIEYGNRVTEWTPAPEDTDAAIADVDEKAVAADTKASTALEAATGAVTAINDYIAGNEIIVGTQTASTSHWTGVAGFRELKDGQKITYWLPVASTSTAVDLNLTLAGGEKTGAIPVFYRSTTRATTHFSADCPVTLNYRENVKIGSTTYAKGWWADVSYYVNQVDRLQLSQPIKIKTGFTTDYPFIVSDNDGYFMLAPNKPFDVTKAILYYNSTADTTSGGTTTSVYLAISQCNLRSNKSGVDLAVGASCYIEGILNGSTFTPSANLFTDTPVNDQNGYYYLLLGYVTSKSSSSVYITLYPEHPIFKFVNGVFKSLNQVAYEANTLASEAKSAAESKNSVYYQTTAPTGTHKVGDTWFDTDNDYKISRWNGSSWVAAELGDAAFANIDASKIKAGSVMGNVILGGTIQAGGSDVGQDGKVLVKDVNDNEVASLSKEGLTATAGSVGGWGISEDGLVRTEVVSENVTRTSKFGCWSDSTINGGCDLRLLQKDPQDENHVYSDARISYGVGNASGRISVHDEFYDKQTSTNTSSEVTITASNIHISQSTERSSTHEVISSGSTTYGVTGPEVYGVGNIAHWSVLSAERTVKDDFKVTVYRCGHLFWAHFNGRMTVGLSGNQSAYIPIASYDDKNLTDSKNYAPPVQVEKYIQSLEPANPRAIIRVRTNGTLGLYHFIKPTTGASGMKVTINTDWEPCDLFWAHIG